MMSHLYNGTSRRQSQLPSRRHLAVQIVLELTSPDPNGDEDDFITTPYVRTVMIAMSDPQTRSVFARGQG